MHFFEFLALTNTSVNKIPEADEAPVVVALVNQKTKPPPPIKIESTMLSQSASNSSPVFKVSDSNNEHGMLNSAITHYCNSFSKIVQLDFKTT